MKVIVQNSLQSLLNNSRLEQASIILCGKTSELLEGQ